MNNYIATISFRDENMPNIGVVHLSAEAARMELRSLLARYAAVKGGWVTFPDGKKDVFSSAGEYLFTVPKI